MIYVDILVQASLLAAVGALFYGILIRPQINRLQRHRALIASIAVGDQVVFAGGLVGVIASLQNDGVAELEMAGGARINALRDSIEQRLPV